jgi:coproporphyrinogen III oxidase
LIKYFLLHLIGNLFILQVYLSSHYLQGLQQRITAAVTEKDGSSFGSDAWQKPPGEPLQGHGLTQILEGWPVFERAGCGFSSVRGPKLPPSATQHRPELAGSPFDAMGVSLVFHPRNPYVPTVHMNVRMLSALDANGRGVCWFGGGMDLTPYYGFEEDAIHFHTACRDALTPFGQDKYPRFKTWCDDYFFLKHRNEARGVGGVFFDDFSELGFDQSFAMLRAVGDGLLRAYMPIVERRHHTPGRNFPTPPRHGPRSRWTPRAGVRSRGAPCRAAARARRC